MDEAINKWLNVCSSSYGSNKEIYCFDNHGYGSGIDSGNGTETNFGNGRGFDYGNGFGNAEGYGCGLGYGGPFSGELHNIGIKSINGHKVYNIDTILTIIYTVHGDVARGAILHGVYLTPCYIYRYNGYFAHGRTVKEAYEDAKNKWVNHQPIEYRIKSFIEAYPTLDTEAHNADLYKWHHVLTGSCRLGRSEFCKTHNIDLTGKTKVKDFINLVKNSYGGKIIIELQKAYLKNQCSNK